MKFLLIPLALALSLSAQAFSPYKCGPFTNKQGLSLVDLSASIIEADRDQLTLVVGKKFDIAATYDLVSTNRGPVFNLYSYEAGPYRVFYNQAKNKFEVYKDSFKASCREVRK